MPMRDENLFFFISHGGTDKTSPELAAVLERLHEAGIPMGIDRPHMIDGLTKLSADDFAWSFDSQLVDWSGLMIRALAEGACGIIVLASANTKKDSHVWQELLAAQAVQASGKPNFGFYLLALEPGAHVHAPNRYRNVNFFDARRELDGQIAAMRSQLKAERIQRAARPVGQRLTAAAMRHTILKTRSVRLVGGGEIALDSVFTPLRGDLLSAAERAAAQNDFLDPLEEMASLQGAGVHEDRLMRIGAIANRILQNPIMPGMPRGQAAAFDPWAVAGAPTNLSDIVDRTGRVVILGEPAAGKSTLLQWLALRFAESWSALDDAGASAREVEVLGLHVDPTLRSGQENAEQPRHMSLGLARLPILTSIPKLCDTLRTKGVGDLVGFLALQLAQLVNDTEFPGAETIAHAVVLSELQRGRLVVLLDGLDEVPEEDRNTALPLIEDFAETWTSATPDADTDPSRNNRLIVTSRIVGYHALPLSAEWPHVVVDRMTPAVVLEFWERLFRSGAARPGEDASIKAHDLHRQVYASGRVGLANLAGIPLLATLLARAFDGEGEFPEYRGQIYERAFAAILQEPGRKPIFPPDYVASWLAKLAYELHASDGPALIAKGDLVGRLIARLKEIDPEIRGNHARSVMVANFLTENERALHLLIERAPELWAFVHRTFQEFLAGRWLNEVETLGSDLVEQLVDPRWREPLLLMLGSSAYAGDGRAKARDALFKALLAAKTAPADRARIGRFLAEAMLEMPDLPSDGILEEVVRALIADLGDLDWPTIPAFARARAMAALYNIGQRDPERLEAAIAAVLRNGPASASTTLALVILDRHWCTPVLEEALAAAELHDSLANGLPIHLARRQVLSEIRHGELASSGKAQIIEITIVAHQGAFSETDTAKVAEFEANASIYEVLRERAVRGRRGYLSRFKLHDANVDDYMKRQSGTQARVATFPFAPPHDVALEMDDPQQLSGLILRALHGDFDNLGRAGLLVDHRRMVRFLALNDGARHTLLEYDPELRMAYGYEDPVYRIAQNLDLVLEPTFKDEIPPYLSAQTPSLSAPLSPKAAALARAPSPPLRWIRRGLYALTPSRLRNPERHAQDILAQAIGDTDGRKPVGKILGKLSATQAAALVGLLRRTLLLAQDAIAHAGHHVAANLQARPEDELALLQVLDTVAKTSPRTPLKVSDAAEATTPRLFTERIAYRLLGLEVHDARYATALSLDAQTGLPIKTLLSALQALPESVTMRWAQATTSCHVGAPWPLDLASPEITLAVLDMTSGVDAGDDMILRSAQASTLFDRLASMPGSLQAASLAPFAVLPRSVIRNRLSIEQAAEQVAAAGEPYHSARFALGLYENGLLESGFEEASAHLTAITNPVLRLDIAERLTKLARAGADETSRQAALEAAGAILEPGQRWRALVRLAWQPGYPQAQLLKAALAAIDMIECPQERLIDASVAARVFSRRPQTLVEIDQSGPIFESLGVGRLASSLCGLPADYGDARGILYVAQTCLDLLSGLEHAAANDTHLHVEEGSLPDWAITAPKVELTVAIADELADLAEAEDPQVPQLPSVELAQRTYITCGYSIFACERWLDRPEHPLAWIAALAIAKGRPRRDRKVLEPLLFAIAADNEEMAAQASLMLTRGSTLVQRPGPDTDYEDMGFETLLWLGRKAVGPEKTRLRLVVACLIMDLQISDAEVITQLFDHMDNNPDDQLAVRFILEHLTWTSAEATRALKARMPGKDPELQAQMLIALAAIDLTQKEDEKRDEAGVVTRPAKRPFTAEDLAQTVQSLGATNNTAPFRIFAKGGEDFCALVEEACRSEPRKERLAGAFYNRLETAQLDIRTPMSDPAASYAALESFLGAKTRAAGEGLPFRHHRKACRALGAGPFGGDAVRLVTELLVDLTRTSRRDYELGGLIAATCVEFALFSPSLVAAALKKQLLGEAGLMAFLAQLIEAPPFGTSSATATALACLLRPLDRACVEALVAISQRPDVGDWILLEQCLVGVGRVERATLPICTSALASDRPRTQLLATRLLGILARDASAGAQTRRTASQALESFLVDPRAQGSIFIYSPATRSQQDGHVLDCGALANIARTELFLADGVE